MSSLWTIWLPASTQEAKTPTPSFLCFPAHSFPTAQTEHQLHPLQNPELHSTDSTPSHRSTCLAVCLQKCYALDDAVLQKFWDGFGSDTVPVGLSCSYSNLSIWYDSLTAVSFYMETERLHFTAVTWKLTPAALFFYVCLSSSLFLFPWILSLWFMCWIIPGPMETFLKPAGRWRCPLCWHHQPESVRMVRIFHLTAVFW